MRQRKLRPIRNTVDLADAKQVRVIKRRFRVSEAEIVDKIGNSIAAIGKEVALQRAAELAQPSKPQVAPVVASVSEPSVTGPTPALQFQK